MLNFAQPLGVERSPNLQTVEMSVKPKKMGRSCREGFWRLQNLDMVCFLGGKVGWFPKTSFKFRSLDGLFFEKLVFFQYPCSVSVVPNCLNKLFICFTW